MKQRKAKFAHIVDVKPKKKKNGKAVCGAVISRRTPLAGMSQLETCPQCFDAVQPK